MLRSFYFYIVATLFVLFSHSIHAQVGVLNPDFGRGGYIDINLTDTIYTGIFSEIRSAKDVRGNIYLSGISDDKKWVVLKLMPDGNPDLTFGTKGYLTILSPLQQATFGLKLFIQVDSEENIYLLGKIGTQFSALKYNRFGQADLSFGTRGTLVLPDEVSYAVAFAMDSNANFYYTGGSGDPYIVKFNRNGILDNSFGTNGISYIRFSNPFPTTSDMLVDSEGYIYLSLQYYNLPGALIKLNQAGVLVNSFGTNGKATLPPSFIPKDMSFDSEERICMLNENLNTNQNSVIRYFTSGLPDLAFGQNGIFNISFPSYTSIYLSTLYVDQDDNILITGIGTFDPQSHECLLLKINTTSMTYDSSFDSDGIVILGSDANIDYIDNIITNTSGTIFASGQSHSETSLAFLKTIIMEPDGTVKSSFTNEKENPNSYDGIIDLSLNDHGDLYLSGSAWYSPDSYPTLTSVTSKGDLNQAFGVNGKKTFTKNAAQSYLAIEKNGYIYSVSTIPNPDPYLVKCFISKTDASGNRVSGFGTNGDYFYTSDNDFSRDAFEILFDQDSSLLIFANHNNGASIRITKITRSGNIDLSYGNQGNILITNAAPIYGEKVVIDHNGSIYISGRAGTMDIFTTKIVGQTIDPLFGIDGFFFHTFAGPPYCSAVSFDSNNNLVLGCYYGNSFIGINAFLYKLTPAGEIVPEFGISGIVTLSPTSFAIRDLIVDKNDNIFLFGGDYGSKTYTAAKVNALGTFDVSYGNNGLAIVGYGIYTGTTYDKSKGVAYLYGITDWDLGNATHYGTDIRIVCLQIEKPNFNTISGTVFKDADASCDKQTTEQGIRNMSIVAQPGNNYSMTDASGAYTLKVDTGAYQYTVKQLLNPIQQQQYVNTCTDQYNIPLTGSEKMVSNINFADKLNPITCPLLYVDVQNTVRRRCYGGLTKIRYANYGTASESNVTIVVTYPEHNIPKSSTPAWQSQSNKILTYNIGTLNPGQEGFITIADSISCLSESIIGRTQCIQVEITPVRNCAVSPMWDHSDIEITQLCRADSSVFFIKNIGTGDMNAARNFNVFVNDTIIYSSTFLLESNSAVSISYPANGKSIRVSAEQHADFPFPSDPSLATQSCNSTAIVNPVHTALTNLPMDDRSFYVAYSCLPIIGSFDPNHKTVTPSGYGSENYINKKDKLDYTIQFQNVGTDTAFKIVLIDTLDSDLDIETLLIESSSHPFTYTLSGRGNPVLKFSFDPIILTDSTSSVLKSQGFVSYSIYPKGNLSEGTVINNKAYIYFDHNSPIITNETMLTIHNEYIQDLSKGNAVAVRNGIVSANTVSATKKIVLYPNPAKEQLHIRSAYLNLKSIQLISITGSIVLTEKLSGNESVIKINTLAPGIYFYTVLDESDNSMQGKIIVE